MKIFGWLFLVGIFGGVLGCNTGCNPKSLTGTKTQITKNMIDLEKTSGLKLPGSAKILSAVSEGGHDGTKFKKWVVASSERPTLLGAAIDGDDNRTFFETLKETMPGEDFGKPVGDKYQFSDWSNEQGQWQAATIETDKGFYLSLENIVLD